MLWDPPYIRLMGFLPSNKLLFTQFHPGKHCIRSCKEACHGCLGLTIDVQFALRHCSSRKQQWRKTLLWKAWTLLWAWHCCRVQCHRLNRGSTGKFEAWVWNSTCVWQRTHYHRKPKLHDSWTHSRLWSCCEFRDFCSFIYAAFCQTLYAFML